MLRAWEMILEGKAYAKRPQCGNCTDCKGHPVPISTTVKGMGSIRSFCQSCWAWSDFHEHRPAPLSMDIMTEWGIFKTRLARPDKGGLRGKLTKEELDKVLVRHTRKLSVEFGFEDLAWLMWREGLLRELPDGKIVVG